MEAERLSLLRRKQYILLNLLGIFLFAFYFLTLNVFPMTSPQLFFGLLNLILGCFTVFTGSGLGPLYFFPSMRELEAYTLNKLGEQSAKRKWIAIFIQFFLAFLFLYQAAVLPVSSVSYLNYMDFSTLFIIAVATLLFINLTLYVENRRFDRSTPEQLADYTRRSILWGIVFVTIFFVLLIIILLLWLSFKMERPPL